MAKYKQIGTTKKCIARNQERKVAQVVVRNLWKKLRYVYSDRAAKPARRCQLKCLFEMKNCYLSH